MIQLNEKYNKVNHYELKSLGRSAFKLTSAGFHRTLLLCHKYQDRQVSLVVFIAAVMALSGLYSFGCCSVPTLTLPSMSPFH